MIVGVVAVAGFVFGFIIAFLSACYYESHDIKIRKQLESTLKKLPPLPDVETSKLLHASLLNTARGKLTEIYGTITVCAGLMGGILFVLVYEYWGK